jgi:hypothetical protein
MASLAAVIAVLLDLGAASLLPQADGAIPAHEIRKAIAWGRLGTPAPYPLASVFDNATYTAAVVYTPAVRIALNARRAHDAGEPYELAQVDSAARSALVYIVMSAALVIPKEGGLVTEADPLQMVVVADRGAYESPLAQSAVWVSHRPDSREPLVLLGETEQGIVIGAFTRQQLCSDCYVMIFRTRRDPPEGGLGSRKQSVVSGAKLGPNVDRFY